LSLLQIVLKAIWFILPAYIANGTPVVVSHIIRKGTPIDRGKNFIDGRRILGDGKTVEGFIAGTLVGTFTAFLQAILMKNSSILFLGFLLSLGAMIGDLIGSFIKRRLGLARGAPAPLLDQLDFLLGAIFFAWLSGVYIPRSYILILIVLTPILHFMTNYVAYKLKLKSVPW